MPSPHSLLTTIRSVDELRGLPLDKLTELCDQARDYLIDLLAQRGGYLGSNLGVIELTAALHYVYQTPEDRIIWDAGHQLLPHLLFTGRREQLEQAPLIPYHLPNENSVAIQENEFDVWRPGHASRSISAALGLATGSVLQEDNKQTVAVIGDASIAAGLAFEAMNHAGGLNGNLLIILNDNNRSIDPNVGALNEYLAEITSSQTFNKMRDEIYDLLGHFQSAGAKMRKAAARLEKAVMAAVTPGSLFDALGLKYYGPIDGHNPQTLVRHLTDMRNVSGPKLLHVVTIKGKGFAPAEREPKLWKGRMAPFDRLSGKPISDIKEPINDGSNQEVLYSRAMADVLTELAETHDDIVGITPSVFEEAGLQHFKKAFPSRAFEIGLAEDHAATFAAGLAQSGRFPVLSMQASLLPRALDAITQDWCGADISGVISLEEAGIAHNKGSAYHSLNDLSLLRSLPGVHMVSPSNDEELRAMLHHAYQRGGIWVIRGSYRLPAIRPMTQTPVSITQGQAKMLREGEGVLLLSLGTTTSWVAQAADLLQEQGLFAGQMDMRFIQPMDPEQLNSWTRQYPHWITIEEGMRVGGLGSIIAEWLTEQSESSIKLTRLGFQAAISEAGDRSQILQRHGFSPKALREQILRAVQA
jgi:1-deoxy-D-xylulose-5-phosphate synthase